MAQVDEEELLQMWVASWQCAVQIEPTKTVWKGEKQMFSVGSLGVSEEQTNSGHRGLA